MIPGIIVLVYLAVVLAIGILASRRGKPSGEDYFVANRSLSQYVFLLALFGTNMTAFAILGSSGIAYHRGIGIFGLLASSSALVIPLTLFFIGTRLWAIGKKFGHMTQVQFFRDRWECDAIGTVIFALTVVMFVPYIIIGVMGGGQTLEAVSTTIGPNGEARAFFSYEVGGALVALVIMSYVFVGGMRGTAWVNAFQTLLFLSFGAAAFFMISRNLGGFDEVIAKLAADPKTAPLLTRQRIPVEEFFSYTLIPLSSIMFPHMAIMCFTAERVTHFKKAVVFYPICMILLWLPCVFLGVVAASQFPGLRPGESDDVLLRLLTANTNVWLTGILGAGIMACVMATDSQILAMSTMFTEDVFAHYGGRKRFGPQTEIWTGRAFVVGVTVVAYLIALQLKDKAEHLRAGDSVRFLRVRSDGPGDDCCSVLEAEQQMGRARRDSMGRRDDVRLLVPLQRHTGNRAQARAALRADLPRTRRPIPAQRHQRASARLSPRPADVPRLSAVDDRRLSAHSAA